MVTRLHHFLIFFPLSFVASVGLGQTVSPLQQVMSTSSLISRPQVFRDMQTKVLEKLHGTTPGLHLDDFYKDMSDARTVFLQRLNRARWILALSPDSNTLLIRLDSASAPMKLNLRAVHDLVSLDTLFARLRPGATELVYFQLDALVRQAFRGIQQEALVAELFRVLNSSGFSESSYGAGDQKMYLNGIAGIIVDYVTNYAKDFLQTQANLSLPSSIPDKDRAEFVRTVEKALNEGMDEFEHRFLRVLDKVEYAVNDVIASASTYLLRGNTGLGISKGTGSFGGGLYVAYSMPFLQAGLYVNSQFAAADTNQSVTRSLFGVHFQGALDRLQIDLLASFLRGDPSGSKQEYGLGISCRVSNGLIVGGALFIQGPKNGLASYGISFAPTASGAPTLFLGVTKENGHFLMQTCFPIGSSN